MIIVKISPYSERDIFNNLKKYIDVSYIKISDAFPGQGHIATGCLFFIAYFLWQVE